MKRILSLILAVMMAFGLFAGISTPAFAADGGEGALHITSHEDGDTVDGTKDVKIKWSKVDGADHYWLTIKDTVTGDKPVNQQTNSRTFTVDADEVFVVDGRTYKVYVAAMDEQGRVLNGGSEWHAVYVTAEYPQSRLVYASPALTKPEVPVQYMASRGAYYGDGGQIAADKDFKIEWEEVHAPIYSITAAILAGEPDYCSTNEAKLDTIVVKDHTSRCRYTIGKEDLRDYEGYYLKVVIQPICDEPGTCCYGQLSMFYFYIGIAAAPDPNPDPQPNPTPDPEPVNAVFFLQNDQRWASYPYGHKDTACTQPTDLGYSGCGILALTNALYNLTGQFVDPTTIADFALNGHRVCGVGTAQSLYKAFADAYGGTYGFSFGAIYESSLFSKMKQALQAGDVVIVNTPGHFLCVSAYENGRYLVLDSLPSSNRGTTSKGDWMTEEEFADKMEVRYIVTLKKNVQTNTPSDQPAYGGKLELALGEITVSGRPGDILEIPLVINSPLTFLQVSFETNIPYCIEATKLMTYTEGNHSAIWYSATAKDVSGQIAIITLMIPEDAEPGETYTFKVVPTSAYTASEKQLTTTTISTVITVEEPVIRGDVDGDGVAATPIDLMRLLKAMLGIPVEIVEAGADVDGDGWVASPIDLIQLLKMMLG